MDCLVGVIVPLYNCEERIVKCVNSILHQTYQNLKVIIVDDCSTDNSVSFLEEKVYDSRLVILKQTKNQGVSVARNLGLEYLRKNDFNGYIAFMDADDYIEPNAIEECLDFSQRNNLDLVSCGFQRVLEDETIESNYCQNTSYVLSKEDAYINIMQSKIDAKLCNGVWLVRVSLALFKSNIIFANQLYFDSKLKCGEDALFVINYLRFSNLVGVISKPLYTWWARFDSLSSIHNKDTVAVVINEYEVILPILQIDINHNNLKLHNQFLTWCLSTFNQVLNRSAIIHLSYRDEKELLLRYINITKDIDFRELKSKSLLDNISIMLIKSKSTLLAYLISRLFILINRY